MLHCMDVQTEWKQIFALRINKKTQDKATPANVVCWLITHHLWVIGFLRSSSSDDNTVQKSHYPPANHHASHF